MSENRLVKRNKSLDESSKEVLAAIDKYSKSLEKSMTIFSIVCGVAILTIAGVVIVMVNYL